MPLRRGYTTRNGKRVGYYQYGKEGKKYTYNPGSREERYRAKEKAKKQMKAIQAQGG